VLRETTDQKGITHSRLRQYYQGVPVFGHQVIVASEDGDATRVNGKVVKGIAADVQNVTPAFDANTALNMVREAGIKIENEKSELTIYTGGDGVARLAYFVSFFEVTENPERPHFIIDARTGHILKQWDGLTHDKIGVGPGGNLKVGKYEYGTDFDFLDVEVAGAACALHTDKVKTSDLNHKIDPFLGLPPSDLFAPEFPDVYSYGCPENSYKQVNGGFSPLNDGHFFSSQVHDMYTNWYGFSPIDMQLLVRIHYGTRYDNAFWNGSSISFGDGYDTFYPLVSMDIVSHEVAHGFTEQNSDLIYTSESGGINEAFSDMAGEAAKFYLNGTNDFRVGFDIWKGPGALRFMSDPTLDGVSIDHADDYYEGLGVHHSSGIFNKAFYLIATAPGWDTRKAFDIFVKANQENWTPNTDFYDAAAGAIDAAIDLGYDPIVVWEAFESVGVEIFKEIVVSMPDEITEGQIVQGTVTVIPPRGDRDRTVYFESDNEDEIIVPYSVPLLAGEIEVTFDIEAVNDGGLDASKLAIIRVSQARTHVDVPITIHDAATATLSVSVTSTSATEGDGVLTAEGKVTVSAPVDTDATISLSSDDVRESTVPASVVVLAGHTWATFDVSIVDDIFVDGTQSANITASVTNWSSGLDSIIVYDNDTSSPVVTVVLPDDAFEHGKTQYGAGTVSLSSAVVADATVSLSSTDISELTVDSSVVIAAGESSATFDFTLVEDAILDGSQSVTVNATVEGVMGSDSLDVMDNEPGIFAFEKTFDALNPHLGDIANRSSGEHEVKVVRLYGSLAANLLYSTIDRNATAGEDYTGAFGTLNFAAGDTEKSIFVPIAIDEDLVFEKDADFFVGIGENFEISLSNPGGIDPAPGNVLIDDDLVVYQYIDPLVPLAKVAKTMDMDGDGDLDIYGASGDLGDPGFGGDRGTTWWENLGGSEGMNQFSPLHVIDAFFIDPLSIHSVDLDGDGDQDMLASDSAEIKIWKNLNGIGTSWSAGQTISLLDDGLSFPADMDGDGDMDIVGTEYRNIYWWENLTGAGTTWSEHFVKKKRMHIAGHGLTVGDIDGDGDMDITRGYHWWENLNGTGLSWGDGVWITNGAGHVESVYLADMDGDDDLDVVTANPNSYQVITDPIYGYTGWLAVAGGTIWYENPDGSGGTGLTEWPSHDVVVPGEYFRFDLVWPSDIDQDGDMDLVGGNLDGYFVGWKENLDGSGTSWDDHTVEHVYGYTSSVFSGDIDGDGDIDIVATGSDAEEVSWFKNPSNDFVEGSYHLSRYVDFSEDNSVFNKFTPMYTKVWSSDIDVSDMKDAYYEIEIGNAKLKGNLVNHQNGYFTEAIDLVHFPEGIGKIKKLKLEDHGHKKFEVKDVAIEVFETGFFNPDFRYWKLSKNADFSTIDTEFSASDTLYVWIHSPVVDHNDMKKAELEITKGKQKVKVNLTNNLDGTFTGSVSMGQFADSGDSGPGGSGPKDPKGPGHKDPKGPGHKDPKGPGPGPGSEKVKLKKLKIEDNTKAKYEIKDVILTVVP
jgi:Zn-dependent metalloprotease